jgi:hypothetical protein
MNLGCIARPAQTLAQLDAGKPTLLIAARLSRLAIGLFPSFRVPSSRLWLFVGLAVVGLGIVYVVVPNILVHSDVQLTQAELLKARNDVRTTGVQILGGALLLGGLLFTNRTIELNRESLDLTRQGQITDRFTHSIDQLGSDKLDIRLGGIYSLERIARDSKPDQGPVLEVLTAFIHEYAPWTSDTSAPTPTASPGTVLTLVRRDVQTVLDVLGRRNRGNDPAGYRVDLSGTNLRWAYLTGANLQNAFFTAAKLNNANLQEAHLEGGHLEGTDLQGAYLNDGVKLNGAVLHHANLQGAFLDGADLTGADLTEANLSGAEFNGSFGDADLSGADLSGASGVTQAQIDAVITNTATKLPPGLKPFSLRS